MNFDLARELEAAGFPQEGRGTWVSDPTLVFVRSRDRLYAPTLEELIAACGDVNLTIAREGGRWSALAHDDERRVVSGECSTPVEAVARLWLALNAGGRGV